MEIDHYLNQREKVKDQLQQVQQKLVLESPVYQNLIGRLQILNQIIEELQTDLDKSFLKEKSEPFKDPEWGTDRPATVPVQDSIDDKK